MSEDAPKAIRLEGARLYLRALRVEDVGPDYLGWMSDPDVTRHLESRFAERTLDKLREYVRRKLDAPAALFLAIVLREGDRHIGNVKLEPINREHGLGEVGILLGARDCWGKGLASDALRVLCEYAFSGLGLRKLTAGAYASNVASLRAFAKAGFHVEARRPRHYRLGDGLIDAVLLARFADDAGGGDDLDASTPAPHAVRE